MAFTLYKEIKYALDGIPGENLTDFPKLVSITADADIASELSGGGGIKFTSADGITDLSFGLYPSTDLSSGTVLARVKLTLLTAASVGDVIARLYYSASESTTEDKAGTVDNGYGLFAPLEADPSGSAPQVLDWTTNARHLTTGGSMTSGDLVAGQVGNALDFDGDDFARVESAAVSGYPLTFEAWFKATSSNGRTLIFVGDGSATDQFVLMRLLSGTLNILTANGPFIGENGPSVSTGAWHHGAISIQSASSWFFMLDGVRQNGMATLNSPSSLVRTSLGVRDRSGPIEFFLGQQDESRVSSVARSEDWLAYAFTDDSANADTFTLGDEQGAGGGNNELLHVGLMQISQPIQRPPLVAVPY